MKAAYFLVFTFGIGSSLASPLFYSGNSSANPQGDIAVQDVRPYSYEYAMAELSRVHKAVYSLPYDYNYIKGTLMPQIEAQRAQIAPHFPTRTVTGDDAAVIAQHFQTWIETHPEELTAYIAYVDAFVLDHQ